MLFFESPLCITLKAVGWFFTKKFFKINSDCDLLKAPSLPGILRSMVASINFANSLELPDFNAVEIEVGSGKANKLKLKNKVKTINNFLIKYKFSVVLCNNQAIIKEKIGVKLSSKSNNFYISSMKIKLIVIGKTDEKYLQEGVQIYLERLKHYIPFEIIIIKDVKIGTKQSSITQKIEEGKLFLSKFQSNDFVVLLDEKGKSFTSIEYADFLQKRMNASLDVVFLIGGPFGFSQEIYDRSNDKLSLSKMTFSHQMVRLFFVEQLYRAFTIIKGEKYHNS